MSEETRSDGPGRLIAERATTLAGDVQEPSQSETQPLPQPASRADDEAPEPTAPSAPLTGSEVVPPPDPEIPEQPIEPEVSSSEESGRGEPLEGLSGQSSPGPTPDPATPPEAVSEQAGSDEEGGEPDRPPEGALETAENEEPDAQPRDTRTGQPTEAPPPPTVENSTEAKSTPPPEPPVGEGLPEAVPAPAPAQDEDTPGDAHVASERDAQGQGEPVAPPAEPGEQEPPLSEPSSEHDAASQVPAELIWSGPDEAEAATAASPPPAEDARADAQQEGPDAAAEPAVWQSAEPQAGDRLLSTAVAAVAAGAVPARPAEPRPGVQPRFGARRLGGYLRFALRFAAVVVAAYAAFVVLLAVLYRWVDPPASTLMLAQQVTGTEIEQRWVPLRRISPHLVQAVILSEDGAFCRHRGVDWSAVGEAIESTREGIPRGGSTITMQVVKNLFLWNWRSYVRKAVEIPLAYLVELLWPKSRVLEIYLNIAEWGDGIFGAEAAARYHFRKSAANLTPQEAALLAVALPNPLDRHPGQPGYLVRRLANNLQARMKTVRTTMGCVRPFVSPR